MNTLENALKYEQYVIDLYKEMHKHPELGGKEEWTMDRVEAELKKMGIDSKRVPHGGIVAKINPGKVGKKVALRADMDGLPLQESKNNLKGQKEIVSEIDGVAHMCGHDGHTAMLLGAARILSENSDSVDGEVVLLFEQGEENGAGFLGIANTIIEEKPDTIWAIHVYAGAPAGKISVDPGPRMAASVPVSVKITGRGGHGSRPDLAINPLDCFVDIYQAMRYMKASYLSPFSATTLCVGQVISGNAGNVIPETLTFSGGVRFTDIEVGKAAAERIRKIINDICELHGCTYELLTNITAVDLRVYNNETCAQIASKAVEKAVGLDAVLKADPWMASESMGIYLKYVPGILAFLGIHNDEKGTGADHHNEAFEIDTDVFKIGVASTVQYVLDFMAAKPEIDFVAYPEAPIEVLKALGFKG